MRLPRSLITIALRCSLLAVLTLPAAAAAQPAAQPATQPAPEPKPSLEIYGFGQADAIRDFMQFTAAIVWRPHIDGNPPTLPRCGCTEAVGVHEAASASTCHFFGQHCEQ